MKAVTYRYSAAENPTWLNQQEADCRRYADEHGMTVTEVFTDVGRSRYGLQGVLDAVEREDETGLIVTDLARLGSKYADHVAVVQQLHDAGADIHVTKDRTSAPGPLTSRLSTRWFVLGGRRLQFRRQLEAGRSGHGRIAPGCRRGSVASEPSTID